MVAKRRDVVVGALGLALTVALPGLTGCSASSAEQSGQEKGSFTSDAMGVETNWVIVYPPGTSSGARLPVVVALHGKGGSHRDILNLVDLAQLSRAPTLATPFALASVDCGDGYFHRRLDGTDAGAMVSDEFLPLLRARGLDTNRLGLLGWSMGGYGALLLAATRLQGRVRAVTTMSAALWLSAAATGPGAFDSAHDYRDHDVFALRGILGSTALRVVCGLSDPFIAADRAFVNGFTSRPQSSFSPGDHDDAYWTAAAPEQLAFASRHLLL